MKICIIEDSQQKLDKIISLVNLRFPKEDIKTFGSYQSGLKYIKSNHPELVILDMTLPTFDRIAGKREGRMRPFGGVDIMRKMQLKGIKSKVIVITQFSTFNDGDNKVDFSDLVLNCQKEFNSIFIGGVKFSHSTDHWQNDFDSIIKAEI
ncbi:hypothetical protein BH581_02010 [Vibrio splendidus]|uniref:response regulator n=1 Tax=Vibrio splendidus TaxID=29497 RepID=UPI0009778E5D|nr:response regulator [Vibrio splendidus]OMO27663.1 hypothetical protein BH581_02010 [Vibrio splendidus]